MTDNGCEQMREALSALLDGEDPGMDREVLDAHVARCADCTRYRDGIAALDRRIRVRRAEPVPDTTGRIMAAIPEGPASSPRRSVPAWTLVAAVLAVVVIAGGAFGIGRAVRGGGSNSGTSTRQVAGSDQQNSNYPGATVLPRDYIKPNLTLTDTSGQPYNVAAQTAGRITLVYFGYTHCPDVCPINMALIASTIHKLPAADRSKISVVFISTDPVRDTDPVIRAWLDNFSPSFVGLRGSEDQIHALEQQVGMPLSYADTPPAGSADAKTGNYQVVHAGYTLVYTPDGLAHLQVDDTEQVPGFATTLEHLVEHGYRAA